MAIIQQGMVPLYKRVGWDYDDGKYYRHGAVQCVICSKVMDNNALAKASHGRMHVRRGEAMLEDRYYNKRYYSTKLGDPSLESQGVIPKDWLQALRK